jgi:hypothetical protein
MEYEQGGCPVRASLIERARVRQNDWQDQQYRDGRDVEYETRAASVCRDLLRTRGQLEQRTRQAKS